MDIKLTEDKYYTDSSDKISIKPNRKYEVSTVIVGLEGKPYCAYFGVTLFDKKKNQLGRRIRWINDFSGKIRHYSFVFQTPKSSDSLQIMYRINKETPFSSSCNLKIPRPKEIKCVEIDDKIPENYENPSQYVLPKSKDLSKKQETELEKNIVWVFGFPRSGTTWLATQLLSHDTFQINETKLGIHLGTSVERENGNFRNMDRFKFEPTYFFSEIYKETWHHFMKKLILNRVYAQFDSTEKKVIIKEVSGNAYDIMAKCLPNSKLIVILRDGRDCIDSRLDSVSEGGWATTYGRTKTSKVRPDFLENWARYWNANMETLMTAYENHPRENRFLIKYEDLIKDTLNLTQKLYDLIQVPITPKELKALVEKYSFKKIPAKMKGKGKFARSATPDKWKENFTSEEQSLLNKVMGKTLSKLGYEVNP